MITADRVSRGLRVQAIQKALFGEGDSNARFVKELNDAAARLRIPIRWENSRLSKIRSGSQDMSLEDVATLIDVAQLRGLQGEMQDWFWLAFGETWDAVSVESKALPIEPKSQAERKQPRASRGH